MLHLVSYISRIVLSQLTYSVIGTGFQRLCNGSTRGHGLPLQQS